MKKILFVVNVDWFFISHRIPIAVKAKAEGYDVHLACNFTGRRAEIEKLGIICHHISFSRSGTSVVDEFNVLRSIRKLINTFNFDIVHAVTIKPVIYTGLVLKSFSRPPAFVGAISGLGYVFTAQTFKAKATKHLVSLLYKLSLSIKKKAIIFQNTSDQLILSDIVNLSEKEQVLIKGSGADLSIYDYQPEPPATRKVVSMACRLLKDKGVYEFVKAAKLVKSEFSDVDFWLIGSIDSENPNSVSQKDIDTWKESGIVEVFGHRDDIPKLFAKSHIVCMPSFYGEGVPKVLIEAAACGRPIVTTDNPGCRDSIIDNETGLLVPIKSAESLAEALKLLCFDEKRRAEMGRRAREYAVKEFDVNTVVARHLDIYESLIGEV